MIRPSGQTPSQVLLHECELGCEVESGGNGVELDQGYEVRLEGRYQAESGYRTGSEEKD